MISPEYFFSLEGHRFAELFDGCEAVWQALGRLRGFLSDHLEPNVAGLRRRGAVVEQTLVLWRGDVVEGAPVIEVGDVKRGALRVSLDGQRLEGATVVQAGAILADDDIQLGEGSFVEAGALIKGPTIIGDRTEVRHGAYLRGRSLIGDGCVVGHATEMKGSVMMGGSQAGHFAYIGDSILGAVNLGAGTKLANLKIFPGNVSIEVFGVVHDTGLRKLGAILGDGVEMGCNSVTSPGTVLGPNAIVYPTVTVRGYHPADTVIKSATDKTSRRNASR